MKNSVLALTMVAAMVQPAWSQTATSPLQRAADATKRAMNDADCAKRCERPLDMLGQHRADTQAAANFLSHGSGATPTAQPQVTAAPAAASAVAHSDCVQRCLRQGQ